MSSNLIPEGACEEGTGFLFTHACGQPAAASCPRCGKRLCDAHLVAEGGELLCATCAEAEDGDDEGAEGGSTTDSTPDEDDPSYYYKDYGYYGPRAVFGGQASSKDPNDFTEADGQSLRNEDDASFEEDLGGS